MIRRLTSELSSEPASDMSRRQQFSLFSLSFLDIMFCGFGAVVLLVLLVDPRRYVPATSSMKICGQRSIVWSRSCWSESIICEDLQTSLQIREDEVVSLRKNIQQNVKNPHPLDGRDGRQQRGEQGP